MRYGLVLSAIAHAALIAWGVVSLPSKPLDTSNIEQIPVDFVELADVTKLDKGVQTAALVRDEPVPDPVKKVEDAPPLPAPAPPPELPPPPPPPTVIAGRSDATGARSGPASSGADARSGATAAAGKNCLCTAASAEGCARAARPAEPAEAEASDGAEAG